MLFFLSLIIFEANEKEHLPHNQNAQPKKLFQKETELEIIRKKSNSEIIQDLIFSYIFGATPDEVPQSQIGPPLNSLSHHQIEILRKKRQCTLLLYVIPQSYFFEVAPVENSQYHTDLLLEEIEREEDEELLKICDNLNTYPKSPQMDILSGNISFACE